MSNHDNILNIKTDGQIAYENMEKYFEEIIDKKKKISDIINNEDFRKNWKDFCGANNLEQQNGICNFHNISAALEVAKREYNFSNDEITKKVGIIITHSAKKYNDLIGEQSKTDEKTFYTESEELDNYLKIGTKTKNFHPLLLLEYIKSHQVHWNIYKGVIEAGIKSDIEDLIEILLKNDWDKQESLLQAIDHGGILQLLIKKGYPEMVYEKILPEISPDNIDDEILLDIFNEEQTKNNKKNISKYLKSIDEFTLLNLIDDTILFKGNITKSDIKIITTKINDPFFLPADFLLKLLSTDDNGHIKILKEWIGKYSEKDIILGIHETNIILNLFQKQYYTSAIMLLSQVNSIIYLDSHIFKHINENINKDIIQKGIAKWFNQLSDYNAAILLEKIGCIKYNGFSKQKSYSPEIRLDCIKEFNIHKINKVCALITDPKITIFIPSEYPSHNDRKDYNNETNIIFLNEKLNEDSNNTKEK